MISELPANFVQVILTEFTTTDTIAGYNGTTISSVSITFSKIVKDGAFATFILERQEMSVRRLDFPLYTDVYSSDVAIIMNIHMSSHSVHALPVIEI